MLYPKTVLPGVVAVKTGSHLASKVGFAKSPTVAERLVGAGEVAHVVEVGKPFGTLTFELDENNLGFTTNHRMRNTTMVKMTKVMTPIHSGGVVGFLGGLLVSILLGWILFHALFER